MANYKLVNADQLDTDLKSVADKIREKAELTEQLTFPAEFISGIDQCSSLNFDVKAYATEEALMAATPKENTIGIITTTPITSWIFSATEPAEPAKGMVWLENGTASDVEFNALKKNGIQVYPLSAKQYIGGEWVKVVCFSYLNGEWVKWKPTLLMLKDGTLYVGQWNNGKSQSQFTDGTINATANSQNGNSGWISEAVDTTSYKKLVFRCNVAETRTNFNIGFTLVPFGDLFLYNDLIEKMVSFVTISEPTNGYKEFELDLGALSPGRYYVATVGVATYSIDYIELM